MTTIVDDSGAGGEVVEGGKRGPDMLGSDMSVLRKEDWEEEENWEGEKKEEEEEEGEEAVKKVVFEKGAMKGKEGGEEKGKEIFIRSVFYFSFFYFNE